VCDSFFLGRSGVIAQETTSFITTQFYFLQHKAAAIDSTFKERSHHNQETRSEKKFTFSRSEEFPLKPISLNQLNGLFITQTTTIHKLSQQT
jgi:hypothetical protein